MKERYDQLTSLIGINPDNSEEIETISDGVEISFHNQDFKEKSIKKHLIQIRRKRFGRRPYGYSESKDEHHRKPWIAGAQTGNGFGRY